MGTGSIWGTIGEGLLKGAGDALVGGIGNLFGSSSSGSQGSQSSGSSNTPYTDRTRDLMQLFLKEALDSYDPGRIKIIIGDDSTSYTG